VDRAFEAVELRPGAADVLAALAEAGVPTAILTGGFERGVRAALGRAGVTVDRVVANRLLDDGDRLTGEVAGPLVEGAKDDVLAGLAAEFDVPLADTVAVGDGANDRAMLEAAGFAIGYEPRPAITDVVDETVDSMPALFQLLRRRGVLD
ncbi:MAG: HAD family hydrolase, partial [Halobacteriales archaeon]